MKKDNIIFTIGIIFLLLISVFSIFLFIKNKDIVISDVSVKPEVKATPTATTVPQIDYKNTEIEVLNATKTKGLAKVYADKLTSLGYTKVTTGNYVDSLDSNLLLAPTDFSNDLTKIGFNNYKFEKNKSIKIIIAK